MRILDTEREQSVMVLQLYLTVTEATNLRKQLDGLLTDPEANEHFHTFADDMSRELSCSILTPHKLETGHYTELERKIFREK